jgi:hypothetical protein
MTTKAVGTKKSGQGLEHPEPRRRRRNTTVADNGRHALAAAARKQASGRGSDGDKIKPKKRTPLSAEAADDGSEMDRRVGHSRANLKGVWARDGKKPSPKKTRTHTAQRNVKLNNKGMTAMLEDSSTGKPSRKSTRKSTNRSKPNQLTRRTKRAVTSPQARAARGA